MRVMLLLLATGWMPVPSALCDVADTNVYQVSDGRIVEIAEDAIRGASNTVLVQSYALPGRLAGTLARAQDRGVRVCVLLDQRHTQGEYSPAAVFLNWELPVFIDRTHQLANDRYMVLDDRTIVTGGVTFANDSAEVTGDRLLLIHNPELARRYAQGWEGHRAHSTPYRKPLITGRELAENALGIALYGSGFCFWPLRRWISRRVRRRGKALLTLFLLQAFSYAVVAMLAFSSIVRLEHGYYWFIILLLLNGLFTTAAIPAWLCDAAWERLADARS